MILFVLKRLYDLGFLNAFDRIFYKIRFFFYQKIAYVIWRFHLQIFSKISFKATIKDIRNLFAQSSLTHNFFHWYHPSDEYATLRTKKLFENKIFIFEKEVNYSSQTPWDYDFISAIKAPKNYSGFGLHITLHSFSNEDPRIPDYEIKTSWDRARFTHLLPLAHLFRKKKFEDFNENTLTNKFCQEIESFWKHNPFLEGIHWMNTMEVSLRATSMIFLLNAFTSHKNALLSTQFLEKYLQSLDQHLRFINWFPDHSDRPNNHYLANWIGKNLLEAFLHNNNSFESLAFKNFHNQILSDTFFYEGSTSYHKLSTEMLNLLYKTSTPESKKRMGPLIKKVSKIAHYCSLKNAKNNDLFFQIGDNDSGTLSNSTKTKKHSMKRPFYHFHDFGLTIMNKDEWVITMRHAAYKKNQPTGHFHDDALGITIGINNIPLIVDPGTGFYTSNTHTRNLLRSRAAHSTLDLQQQNNRSKTQDLFAMKHAAQSCKAKMYKNWAQLLLEDSFKPYRRMLALSNNTVTIIDTAPDLTTTRLLFHPLAVITKQNNKLFHICLETIKIALQSSQELTIEPGFYAPHYHTVIKTNQLVGLIDKNELSLITLHKIL